MRTYVLVALLLALPAPVLSQVEVTSCSQTIEGTDAFLGADLQCAYNERLSLCDASLDLQGFTLTGEWPVFCPPRCTCTVRGPGTINGWVRDDGLWQYSPADYARQYVENVTMTNANGPCGVYSGWGRVSVSGSVLSGCAIQGGNVSVSGSEVTGNIDSGIQGERVAVSDSRLAENGYGLQSAGWVVLKNVTIEQNVNAGVRVSRPWRLGGKLSVLDSAIRDNGGDGVIYEVTTVKLKNSSITGNGGSGFARTYDLVSGSCPAKGKFRAVETNIAGNRTAASCSNPDVLCVDVDSCVEPRLKDSNCEHSHVTASGIPGDDWNVCTAD